MHTDIIGFIDFYIFSQTKRVNLMLKSSFKLCMQLEILVL